MWFKRLFSPWSMLLFCSLLSRIAPCAIPTELDSIEQHLSRYLNRRLREVKVDIFKEYLSPDDDIDPVVEESYDMKWKSLESQQLNFSEPILAFSMFDKMFILENNRTLSLDTKSASNISRSALLFRPISLLNDDRQCVNFAKTIIWKSRLYFLDCDWDSCNLSIGEDDSRLKHNQTLKHGGIFDATFFTRDNRLYLIATHEMDKEFLSSSTIYYWTGTYMDMIQTIATYGGDVMVTTFNDGKWSIIVFARPSSNALEIWKFRDNKVEWIQYLPTIEPISITHYRQGKHDFLLIAGKREPSCIYGWDGMEFFHWQDLPDIIAPKKIDFLQFNGDTLLIVTYENSIRVYKVSRSKYWLLNSLDLRTEREKVRDVSVQANEDVKVITVLLIIFDPITYQYRVQPWNLVIEKYRKNNSVEFKETKKAETEQCMLELQEKLKERMISMKNLTRWVWPKLLGSQDNVNERKELVIEELVLDSNGNKTLITIDRIEIENRMNESEPLSTIEHKRIINSLSNQVISILNKSRETLRIDGDNYLTGNISIEGDAQFREIQTNSMRTSHYNGRRIVSENFYLSAISASKNQTFANSSLRGNNVKIHQLEVERMCGIPRDFWLRRKNEDNNIFSNFDGNEIIMINDTVFIHNSRDFLTVVMQNLTLHTINRVNVTNLFDDLFILGEKQFIKGNIFHAASDLMSMNVENLVSEKLNGIPVEDLITKDTEQNFTHSLHIAGKIAMRNIVTEKINGIPVSDFAMVNKKNHFTGNLTIAKITVSNSLSITNELWQQRQLQIYGNVTVFRSVKTRDIKIEATAESSLKNIINATQEYWRISSEQTIENPVSFDKGLIVDELNVDYLNNVNINEDIIFTNSKEIVADAYSLEFKNFSVNEIKMDDQASTNIMNEKFYEESDNSIHINEPVHIEQLSVTDLLIENFNGVPFDLIMKKNLSQINIDANEKFQTLVVNDRLEVENLYFNFLVDGTRIDKPLLRLDANFTVPRLESNELFVGDLRIGYDSTSNYNLIMMKNNCYIKKSDLSGNCSHLTIEGDAVVENNLFVSTINGENISPYLEKLSVKNLSVNADNVNIGYLKVRDNMKVNLIHGSSLEKLYASALSKSRDQNLGYAKIKFLDVFAEDLNVYRVNDRDMTNLILIDNPELVISGDSVFENLTMSSKNSKSPPDIQVKFINGIPVDQLYATLGNISLKLVDNLEVRGNVTWPENEQMDSENSNRLETLLRYGLRRNNTSPSTIKTNTDEEILIKSLNGVFVVLMTKKIEDGRERGINGIDIESIVRDSVLDDPRKNLETRIDAEKIFKKNLYCYNVSVSNAIDIKNLSNETIADLNSSVVRFDFEKENNDLFSEKNVTIIFRKGIVAKTVIIESENTWLLHGSPIDGIYAARVNKNSILPPSTYFEHLVILNSTRVQSFDSVDFDEFLKNRISIDSEEPVVIKGNFQFNQVVKVSENASVFSINAVFPSDLVLNDSPIDQIITGHKTLISGDLVINGQTYAPLIAGINLTDAYNNSVQNYEEEEIFGDIIFEADVENQRGSIKTLDLTRKSNGMKTGFVNGIRLRNFAQDRENADKIFYEKLKNNESQLATTMSEISNVRLPEIFYYLEEDNFTMSNVENVERIGVRKIDGGDKIALDLYTKEFGSFCNLPETCQCRGQSIVELTQNDFRARKVEGSQISYHFHKNESFVVKVTTTSVSRSKYCSRSNNSDDSSEFTTISWMSNQRESVSPDRETENELKIDGYVSDVSLFAQNDLVFIVLAIYYNAALSSHDTNSFIYVLNPATNEWKLAQCIPTSYVVGVQVINIPNEGRHILFSSHAEGNSSEAVLYRFQANSTELVTLTVLQKFPTNGNRHAKSVSQPNGEFLFLDDVETNSINVYRYESDQKKFYHYQSIYYEAPIASIQVFYTGEFLQIKAYVIVVTERDQFFIYEYSYTKFREIIRKRVSGILSMIPFEYHQRRYIFLGAEKNSRILRIVEENNKKL